MRFPIAAGETADSRFSGSPVRPIAKWIFVGVALIVVSNPPISGAHELAPIEQGSREALDLKFSHRFHLSGKAACEDCHGATRNSESASDDLLPSEQTCLKCHNGRQARNQCVVCHKDPRQVRRIHQSARTFRFSHKLHLELGDLTSVIAAAIESGAYLSPAKNVREYLDPKNPCSACHRGLEKTDLASNINLAQMADCVVCHAEIDPPFSCKLCHTENAQIKPSSHTPDYLDSHNGGKVKSEKESCVICHGRHFRCMGCH